MDFLVQHFVLTYFALLFGILSICIRALDYCPPVDVTFGEYLRAMITADCDLLDEDDKNYRFAVSLAGTPDEIRGFGPVKELAVKKTNDKQAVLLSQFNNPQSETKLAKGSVAEPAE